MDVGCKRRGNRVHSVIISFVLIDIDLKLVLFILLCYLCVVAMANEMKKITLQNTIKSSKFRQNGRFSEINWSREVKRTSTKRTSKLRLLYQRFHVCNFICIFADSKNHHDWNRFEITNSWILQNRCFCFLSSIDFRLGWYSLRSSSASVFHLLTMHLSFSVCYRFVLNILNVFVAVNS